MAQWFNPVTEQYEGLNINSNNMNTGILPILEWQKQNNGLGLADYAIDINKAGTLEGNYYSSDFSKQLGNYLGSLPLDRQQDFFNNIRDDLLGKIADSDEFRNAYSNATSRLYGINPDKKDDENISKQSATDATSQWLNYIGGGVKIGTSIANTVLGYKNFNQNKKLIDKQIQNIDEQIAASKEYRQQRKDEIDRLNRVRSNTSKSFNTGSVITRSY